MIRYYFIATIIVMGCAVLLGGWWALQSHKRLSVGSVTATMAPRAESPHNPDYMTSGRPFVATVPWALSALPECVRQTLLVRGSEGYVRAKIPSEIHAVRSPATLHYADCTITITGETARITRGRDLLIIPPVVRFYTGTHDELFVVRHAGGNVELRVYQPVR